MKYCLLLLSGLLVIAACEKTEVSKSKQDILRDSKWRLDTATVTYMHPDTRRDTTHGAWGTGDRGLCRYDDYLVFREGNTGELNSGEMKCPGGETQEGTIKWGITDGDTKMYIYDAGDMFFGNDINAQLTDFQDNQFTLKFPLYGVEYVLDSQKFIVDTVRYTVTMKKK